MASTPAQAPAALTILYDGGCPLCLREVRMLQARDLQCLSKGVVDRAALAFVDVDAPGYDPAAHGGITYRQAMERIHAISADGTVLTDVAVFRRAYALVGLGWIYAPSRWPLLGGLIDRLYRFWAAWRLRITGRPSLEQLCDGRCQVGRPEPALRP